MHSALVFENQSHIHVEFQLHKFAKACEVENLTLYCKIKYTSICLQCHIQKHDISFLSSRSTEMHLKYSYNNLIKIRNQEFVPK
jgi:hypothetical protein